MCRPADLLRLTSSPATAVEAAMPSHIMLLVCGSIVCQSLLADFCVQSQLILLTTVVRQVCNVHDARIRPVQLHFNCVPLILCQACSEGSCRASHNDVPVYPWPSIHIAESALQLFLHGLIKVDLANSSGPQHTYSNPSTGLVQKHS